METFKDVFIKEFVKHLIANSVVGKPVHTPIERLEPRHVEMLPSTPVKTLPIIPAPKARKVSVKMTKEIPKPRAMPLPAPQVAPQAPAIKTQFDNEDFGAITPILSDPRVEAVECPGPNKNVLVRKDGTLLSSKVILTKESIDKIVSNISQKTKVPIVGGVFKALMDRYIFTAVMSEFAGTSFIVQKRNPFEQLIPS